MLGHLQWFFFKVNTLVLNGHLPNIVKGYHSMFLCSVLAKGDTSTDCISQSSCASRFDCVGRTFDPCYDWSIVRSVESTIARNPGDPRHPSQLGPKAYMVLDVQTHMVSCTLVLRHTWSLMYRLIW